MTASARIVPTCKCVLADPVSRNAQRTWPAGGALSIIGPSSRPETAASSAVPSRGDRAAKHCNFPHVNLWPRPYQAPHPPIWIPSQGPRETIEFAAAPERRYVYLQTATPVVQLFKCMQAYRDEALRRGYEASPDQLGWSVKIYVAETDEIARREAKPHIEAFANKFMRMPTEVLLPPGYTSIASMKGLLAAKRGISTGRSMETMIEDGTFLCGGPQAVIDALARHQAKGGFNIVMAGLQFGTLPAEPTRKNTELFAREVMPALRGAAPGGTVQAAAE